MPNNFSYATKMYSVHKQSRQAYKVNSEMSFTYCATHCTVGLTRGADGAHRGHSAALNILTVGFDSDFSPACCVTNARVAWFSESL